MADNETCDCGSLGLCNYVPGDESVCVDQTFCAWTAQYAGKTYTAPGNVDPMSFNPLNPQPPWVLVESTADEKG